MNVRSVEIPGLLLVEPEIRRDSRGFFFEKFQIEKFMKAGLPHHFVQDNFSRSMPGVLRGLHFQRNPNQGKLISVTRGKVFDVAVDLRRDSPTYGQHFSTELSDENCIQLWIPGGFAHGFCVLGDDPADVLYKVDCSYSPGSEGGIVWNDPDLKINWPVKVPIVSDRDLHLPRLRELKIEL